MKKFRYLITLCISLYTSSAWCAREAYIVVEDSVMTFYYDELRDTHQANTYPIKPFLWGSVFEDRQDADWFYWKGGVFKWPVHDRVNNLVAVDGLSPEPCYNLQGMRIGPRQKGILVQGGKKFVVK